MARNEPRDRSQQSHAAAQYLIWALEEIETSGPPEAVLHARNALDELRRAAQTGSLSEAETTT
jgi:hypothetical protein